MSSDSFSFLINQVFNDIDNSVVYVKGLLALIGAWYTIKLSVQLSSSIACSLKDLRLLFRKTNFVKSYGSWVIITGQWKCPTLLYWSTKVLFKTDFSSLYGNNFCHQLAIKPLCYDSKVWYSIS